MCCFQGKISNWGKICSAFCVQVCLCVSAYPSFSHITLESCQKYLLANVDVPVQVMVKSFPI